MSCIRLPRAVCGQVLKNLQKWLCHSLSEQPVPYPLGLQGVFYSFQLLIISLAAIFDCYGLKSNCLFKTRMFEINR